MAPAAMDLLPGGTHEGDALPVFLLAGTLADEHDLCPLVADAEDQLMPRLPQGAAAAGGTLAF